MKCDTKTMIKVGLCLGTLLAVAYFTLPAARELISVIAPFLLFLICPLSMIFMMKNMSSCHKDDGVMAQKSQERSRIGAVRPKA